MKNLLPGVITLVLQLAIVGTAIAQPMDLQVSGPYRHGTAKVDFPEKIEQYKRISVRAYDADRTDISASYEWLSEKGQTLVTVYAFPAFDGKEGRLRRHYLSATGDMQRTSGVAPEPVHMLRRYNWEKYKLNGFSATIMGSKVFRVTVFECGQWFFKIRSTTALLDSAELSTLELRILDAFQPARMVRDFPLNVKGDIIMSPEALRDSLMTTCTIQSANQKMLWAQANVDSLERLSGFPDLYLDLHVSSFRKFAEAANSSEVKRKSRTKKYVADLNRLIDGGYLEEFVAERYRGVVIVPPRTILDMEGFQGWKKKNKMKSDLDNTFHLIVYRAMTQ